MSTCQAMPRLAIWGAGGHARVVAEAVQASGAAVACHLVDVDAINGRIPDCDAAAVPVERCQEHDDVLRLLRKHHADDVALGVGQCRGRLRLGESLLSRGVVLSPIVHPSSVVSPSSRLGRGVFIGAGCVVDPGVTIGDFTIVNHQVTVCHDSAIGRACHLCPGVTIAGCCTVGDLAWIGVGSTVRDHVSIQGPSFIGAGSNVVGDIPPQSLAYGNPARPRKQFDPDY